MKKEWAFTLIELLVVIAVIAILAALLLPGLEVTNQSRGFFFGLATLPTPAQMAFRHNQREHFLMVDTHIERFSRTDYANAAADPRFWYPTEATDRGGNPWRSLSSDSAL